MFGVDQSIQAVGGRVDPETAPARPAVVLLVDAAGTPVLLATTADARGFLRKRLGGGPGAGALGAVSADADGVSGAAGTGAGTPRLAPRADLSAIVARVDLTLVGSGFEADLAFLQIARRVMPRTCEALTEHWRGWFVHLNPEATGWRKTNLADVASGAMEARVEHLVGPVNSKDLAGKLGERIDDAFDLCRFPRELALAPRGTACAYKEMGRCPAPCDGSEPVSAYRDRVRAALDTLRLEPSVRGVELQAQMERAAERQDYLGAAAFKGRMDRLDGLARPALREARPMDVLRFVGVFPSRTSGSARAWWVHPWGFELLGEFDAGHAEAAAKTLLFVARDNNAALGASLADRSSRRIDPALVGVLTRHLFKKRAARGAGLVRVSTRGEEGDDPGRWQAVYRKLIRGAGGVEASDVEEFDRATLA